jgi:hypothetical protein
MLPTDASRPRLMLSDTEGNDVLCEHSGFLCNSSVTFGKGMLVSLNASSLSSGWLRLDALLYTEWVPLPLWIQSVCGLPRSL